MVEEKEHILQVLKEAKEAFRKNDIIKLRDLSNQTIHSASIKQDETSIAIAVVIYSISKILERTNYQSYPGWVYFFKKCKQSLEQAVKALKRNDEEGFKKHVKAIEGLIDELTGNFKMHIQQVFEKAKISKASRIYEHGISLEQTANLLGITLFELAEYAGRTGISDINLSRTLDIKKRLKYIQEIFE
jgi:hypothetical protein